MIKAHSLGLLIPAVYPDSNLLEGMEQFQQTAAKNQWKVHCVLVDDTGRDHPMVSFCTQWSEREVRRFYIRNAVNMGQHRATWQGLRYMKHCDWVLILDDDLVWDPSWTGALFQSVHPDFSLTYFVPPHLKESAKFKLSVIRLFARAMIGTASPEKGSSQRLLRCDLVQMLLTNPPRSAYLDATLWARSSSTRHLPLDCSKRAKDRHGIQYSLRTRFGLLWGAFILQESVWRVILWAVGGPVLGLLFFLAGGPGWLILACQLPLALGLCLTLWSQPFPRAPHED